jgi:hypothetical protein
VTIELNNDGLAVTELSASCLLCSTSFSVEGMSSKPEGSLVPDPFHIEAWKNEGKQYHRKHLENSKDSRNWGLGDWLIKGQDCGRLHVKELKRYATMITAHPWSTLDNCMSICRRVPPSRRREGLSYSLHVLVAPFFEDTIIQEMLLERAMGNGNGKPLSVRELQTEIKGMQGRGSIPPTNKLKGVNTTGPDGDQRVVIKGIVGRKAYDFLKQLAAVRRQTPELVLWDMAIKYYKENKDELQVELDEGKNKSEQQ